MHARITRGLRRGARWMLIGTAAAAGALVTADSASAATIATFNHGVLTVFGDGGANTITVSRDGAGTILVNNGAIRIIGPRPTVANTALVQMFALGGNDAIRFDETNGSLPRANLFGGSGNDRLAGGAGRDLLFGQTGDDIIEGRGGSDAIFGGGGTDTVTGGDADDHAFGEGGDDTLVWNPGDDTDLNEGGAGTDTVQVNGGAAGETFTATANGSRLRFDRVTPAPFAIDIGTSEALVLDANAGDDSFSATGDLAPLIAITADGGAGADTLLGSNGADRLLGGDDDDFVDGQQGNDIALVGNGDDTFQWDPGDGSDVVEGQDGTDTMVFNGSGGDERFDASAIGERLRFTRDLGNIVMDTDDLEVIDLNTLGGTDVTTVNDLAGTDVVELRANLAGVLGGTVGDAVTDTVVVNGGGDVDNIDVFGDDTSVSVTGLHATVHVAQADGATDSLVVNTLGGDDVVSALTVPAGLITPTLDAGAGDDTILGSQGADRLLAGNGADSVFGSKGDDLAVLGAGDDTLSWDPGDGNDTVEGQDGADTMIFLGANVNENVAVSANGGRVRFFRDVANVTMDLDDVETVDFAAIGGADNVAVGDLSGTDLTTLNADLGGFNGAGDGSADTITVDGTSVADAFGASVDGGAVTVFGLHTAVNVLFPEPGADRLVLDALGGDDIVDASGLGSAIQLIAFGADGGDVLIGGAGNNVLDGGADDDVVIGGIGDDVLDGGAGDDVLIGGGGTDVFLGGEIVIQSIVGGNSSALAAEIDPAVADWLVAHVQIVDGRTVVTVGGRTFELSGIDLSVLHAAAIEFLAAAAAPAPVGDFVWVDVDRDGLQDAGEPGLGGVAVRLLDADRNVVAKDVTDGNGRYELVPAEPGDFTLQVVIPDGFQPTVVNVGGDDAVDSDVDPATVVIAEPEATVRVAVLGDAPEGSIDVGLVELPVEPVDTTTTTSTTVSPTEVTTTVPPTTVPPTTGVPTTGVPVTEVPTTPAPTTEVPVTEAPTTAPPATTTAPPATEASATEAPTSAPVG